MIYGEWPKEPWNGESWLKDVVYKAGLKMFPRVHIIRALPIEKVTMSLCPTPHVDYRLPRPLWLLQEELQEHLRCEPVQKEAYLHTNWERRKEALEVWIEIGKRSLDSKG